MSEEWASFPKIAQQLGLSDNTIRRYVTRFPAFFAVRNTDGTSKLPVEAAGMLKQIFLWYQEGKERDDIRALLSEKYAAVLEHDTGGTIPNTPANIDLLSSAVGMVDTLKRIAASLETLTDTTQKVQELSKENTELKARLERIEARLTETEHPLLPTDEPENLRERVKELELRLADSTSEDTVLTRVWKALTKPRGFVS